MKWIFIGLVIRLILMPFFTHLDLLTDYWVAHITSFEHRLPVEIKGGIYSFSLLHYFHAFSLKIFSFFDPHLRTIWFEPWGLPDNPGMTTIPNWLDFVSDPEIFKTLFFLKLPYLFFDIGIVFLFIVLLKTAESRLYCVKFWMLNPISLFVTYLFSRYEVIPTFLIVCSILFLQKKKMKFGSLCLGLAFVMKLYAVLYIPFYVLAISKDWSERVKHGFWILLPGFMMILFALILGQASEFSGFTTLSQNDYMLGLNLLVHPNDEVHYVDRIYLFIVVYVLLFFMAEADRPGWESFVHYTFILLTSLFALSFFHPHYYFWILPFWALILVNKRKFLFLFIIQISLLFIYSFHWGKPLFGYLVAPVAPVFFAGLPSPYEFIDHFYPADKLVNMARSVFTGTSLWLIYQLFRQRSKSNSHD